MTTCPTTIPAPPIFPDPLPPPGGGGSPGGDDGSGGNDGSGGGTKDPCEGNPVEDPKVAAQSRSGVQGGRYGNTRSGGSQFHGGIDIANSVGSPFYAMYGGEVVARGYADKLGFYVTIQVQINNAWHTIQYAHLQSGGRPSLNSDVSTGDLIGRQGLSGNLKEALNQGFAEEPHSHITVNERTGDGWNLEDDFDDINPEKVMNAKFNEDGEADSGTDC